MEVIKVIPRGFCLGVVKSIKLAKDTVKQYPNRNIYMIGYLVHNKIIVNELNNMGIKTLDDFKTDRMKLIDLAEPNSVLIFSAHGTSEEVINYAINQGHTVVDTKCEWVLDTEVLIKDKLDEGFDVIFIGKHHHPETIALTSINKDRIHLVTSLEEAQALKLPIDAKLFATNQTTLSIIDTDNIYKYLIDTYKNLKFKNDICDATLQRQKAVLSLSNDVDLLYVVGDQRSNNTLKLVELGNSKGIKTLLIEDVNGVNKNDLHNLNKVAVTAGASTSSLVQNNVIKYLETI